MRHEQTQIRCARCGDYTLHVRDVETVPHLIHAAITLFLFGLWLPVWVIHAMIVASKESQFRCSRCGQAQGELTPEELAICDEQRRAEEAIRRQEWEEEAERGRQQIEAFWAAVARGLRALGGGLAALPGWTSRGLARADRAMGSALGEPGDVLHWFLRGILAALRRQEQLLERLLDRDRDPPPISREMAQGQRPRGQRL